MQSKLQNEINLVLVQAFGTIESRSGKMQFELCGNSSF
ncbi:hypothetical protein NAP1_04280 [Erythrobacter sp. NAP1]|nr:hypothetical protein NAP1_04280 [Erythrobacter sp. NAP1]